jgi:hypothetical protein
MELLESIVSFINGILWDYVLIFGLVGIGLYLTLRLGFIQVKRFGPSTERIRFASCSNKSDQLGSYSTRVIGALCGLSSATMFFCSSSSLLGVELFSDSIISHSFAVYVAGVSILSFLFFVGRYNQHHGTAHFILHPRNIHHVFRRLRLHNLIYYKTI